MNDMLVNQKKSIINRTPDMIAAEINSIKDQTRNILLYNSIEIGRRLVEAKELVPHGEWGNWLEDKVDYSQRTAQNLMKIFNEYGSSQITMLGNNAKSQAIANLSYTQAVALLGIANEEEREEFIKENNVENMSTRELQQAIKEREEALKAKKELEEKLKAAENKAEENKHLYETISDSYNRLEKVNKKHYEKSEKLRKELENTKMLLSKAQASGDNDEAERLQNSLEEKEKELKESLKKIEELKEELNQPLEPVVVEKIPDAIEKELADLRQKAQGGGVTTKFKAHFDILVKNFNDILNDLEEMSDNEELHEKYRNAVHGLIDKIVESL